MKKLLIFALFLLASCEDTILQIHCSCELTISDALPVQFWLTDCQTYNEYLACGVHHKCFCQPWNCDDEIVLQFEDDSLDDFELSIIDEDENEIDRIAFIPDLHEVPDMEALSGWENGVSGGITDWTTGATPSVGAFTTTKNIKGVFLGISGVQYNFSYNITLDLAGSTLAVSVRVRLLDESENILASTSNIFVSDGTYDRSVQLTPTADCTHVAVQINSVNPSNGATLNSFSNDSVPFPSGLYNLSFIPSELSPQICDEKVRFYILNTSSPEETLAKSDCLDIRQSHECTELLTFSNHEDFAGLAYENQSPDVEFNLRTYAIFFHERFPQQVESIELSNSRTINTNGVVKRQKLFETDYLPYYMHKKLQLILTHQFIEIDNTQWILEEPYEIQDGDRRWPVKKAKVWLTEKTFVQRNVL